MASSNPLLEKSTLPLCAPPFNDIKFEHYEEAFKKGIESHLSEINAIKENNESPTFENTIRALEISGQDFLRSRLVFDNMCAANTSPEMQDLQEKYAPIFSAHYDQIFLDGDLYQRIHTVYNNISSFSGEEARLIEYYEREFLNSGANLSSEKKEELKRINERLASLEAAFGNLLLDIREKGMVLFNSAEDLLGLPESDIKKAQENAERLGHNGKYGLILTNTMQQPVTAQLQKADTRKKVYEASFHRAEQKDADTRPILEEIVNLRLKKAHLCDKECFADWLMQDRMATRVTAVELLEEMGRLSEEKFEEEVAEVMKVTGVDKLEPWDWLYLSEQVRKTKYEIDETKISEYFELNTVLEKGVFFVAEKLYGLTFKKTNEFPVYHEDVSVYKVFEENGDLIALYYLDPYSRSNKQGGAWMSNFVEQSLELSQKPVVVNVTNFPQPQSGRPCLLTFRNVVTIFHEFGHGLHGMLSNTKYRSLSGTSVARDFLEFPSQINEHWATFKPVLHNYAMHYETGNIIPDDLITKLEEAENSSSGFQTLEVVKAAMIDLHWHSVRDASEFKPPLEMENEGLSLHGFKSPIVPPRYRSSFFAHVFQGGYASSYYVYQWARVLDCDGFVWFEENGGLTRKNGDHLRETVLSVGNSVKALDAFKNFAGRTASIAAFVKKNGFKRK